ncbi:MAG: IS1595 family transposase [Nitrospira sp.]|nr:IS1595 family transposase [Nitrospira sp.]
MASSLLPRTHLSTRQLRALIRLFALEVPANRAAQEIGVNRHTAERIYLLIRRALVQACETEARLDGEIEVDESYFGGVRKHLRGRAVQGKGVVFGLLKRRGRVYTRPVPNVTRAVLRRIIRQKVPRGSTISSDGFRSYDGLLTDGYRHYRILHEQTFAHSRRRHINGIENFWGFAKTKLRRYYGIRRSHFVLYLKEMEFRFNHRREDLPRLIERILKKARPKLD